MITKFLFVGGYNTVIGYLLFITLNQILGENWHYLMILAVSYILSVTHAYWMQRLLVFQSKGAVFDEYKRFFIVNLTGLGINAVLLTLLIKFELKIDIAQAIAVLVTTAISYLGHKNFSFRT